MGDEDAVGWAVGSDGHTVHYRIDGVTQEFKTGNEPNIQFAGGETATKGRGVIKLNLPRPPSHERAGVEIFYAAEPRRQRLLHSLGAG